MAVSPAARISRFELDGSVGRGQRGGAALLDEKHLGELEMGQVPERSELDGMLGLVTRSGEPALLAKRARQQQVRIGLLRRGGRTHSVGGHSCLPEKRFHGREECLPHHPSPIAEE